MGIVEHINYVGPLVLLGFGVRNGFLTALGRMLTVSQSWTVARRLTVVRPWLPYGWGVG